MMTMIVITIMIIIIVITRETRVCWIAVFVLRGDWYGLTKDWG